MPGQLMATHSRPMRSSSHTVAMTQAHPSPARRDRPDVKRPARPPTKEARSGGRGYLRLHWRGELPLAAAVMASAALLWLIVQLVAFISRRVPITDHPHAAAALLMLEML